MSTKSSDPMDGGGGARGPSAPAADQAVKLAGRHVFLQPVRSQDYETLRLLELSADLVPLWRHRGGTPSPEQWAQSLWSGVLAQFLVFDDATKTPLGLVSAYNADFRDGFVYMAAAKFDFRRRSPLFLEGVVLFIEYLFTVWDFRKLYAEASGLSVGQYNSGSNSPFVEEGLLREHRYFGGKLWDLHILALYRETWNELQVYVQRFL